ncbi:uncharacterized protein LOC134542964 isoform X2 [Bacillus rossius redtenbacheri]
MVVPRVIAELLKSDTRQQQSEPQPRRAHRLTGQLHWYEHGSWLPRTAEVSGGCLLVRGGPQELRLPLRRLSLRPASQPRAFALVAPNDLVVAMFKVASQAQYDGWVKALAAELLRQTPLEEVRFLDILAISATVGRPEPVCTVESGVPAGGEPGAVRRLGEGAGGRAAAADSPGGGAVPRHPGHLGHGGAPRAGVYS